MNNNRLQMISCMTSQQLLQALSLIPTCPMLIPAAKTQLLSCGLYNNTKHKAQTEPNGHDKLI